MTVRSRLTWGSHSSYHHTVDLMWYKKHLILNIYTYVYTNSNMLSLLCTSIMLRFAKALNKWWKCEGVM